MNTSYLQNLVTKVIKWQGYLVVEYLVKGKKVKIKKVRTERGTFSVLPSIKSQQNFLNFWAVTMKTKC